MPRPPVLTAIDWREVFENGKSFSQWLAAGENPENSARIERNAATLPLDGAVERELKSLSRSVQIIAIAEDWCGDVVRHVPALERLAKTTSKISTRYIARVDHPEVFARYLTNGGESIPKFIFFSEEFVECGNWGPMPDKCREWIARGKVNGNVGAARKKVSALYDSDPELRQVIGELMHFINIATAPLE